MAAAKLEGVFTMKGNLTKKNLEKFKKYIIEYNKTHNSNGTLILNGVKTSLWFKIKLWFYMRKVKRYKK